ncbi:MAG: WbqC family protein [Bacteroidia bacterium]|nr:WbqC family protein [Bacteroidia bacterium]
MRAVIHQPDFMPYIGFFHRLLHADQWIVFDHVQFLSNSKSWHHRDKIKSAHGERWLTVSVKKCPQKTPINEVLLSDTTDWRSDNLNLIRQDYRQSAWFNEIFPRIEKLYSTPCERLVEFNILSIEMLMEMFDVRISTVLSSSLSPEGAKNELLIDLLSKVGADEYLSGVGAKDYLRPELFDQAGIKLLIQQFTHPVYPQINGDFIPFLSSIDILFNCGIEKSSAIIRSI